MLTGLKFINKIMVSCGGYMGKFDYKKSLGQNFIKDNNIIDKIVKAANVDKDTLVIEVGPGAGSLSKKIIPEAGYAVLYEIDTRLKVVLENELGENDNYQIIFNDVLKQNVKDDIEKFNYQKRYLVANLPYYITTPIITKMIDEITPDKIVIMIQDEVADRLSAQVGTRDYGMITVLLSARYNIKKLFKVSRHCFEPVPGVDSAVICLDKKNNLVDIDMKKFEKFIKDAFQYKRKNLRNNLKNYDLEKIDNVLKQHELSISSRAEEISTEMFIELFKSL